MQTLIQALLDGLLIGGIYSVIAVGLTVLFGVANIVNFAHGSFVMAAAYLGYVAFTVWGVDPYVAMPVLAILFFFVGLAFYLLFLRRLVGLPLLAQALFTIGIALIMGGTALAIFGPETKTFSLPWGLNVIQIGGITLEWTRVAAFVSALLVTVTLYLLLWKTTFGIELRAAAANQQTAELVGIRTRRIQAIATGISLACAAVAGAALLPIVYVAPTMGEQYIFLAFVIVVIGGLGNFWGALVGGVLIGLTQSLGTTYFNGTVAQIFMFALFVFALLVRPNGLFARKEAT